MEDEKGQRRNGEGVGNSIGQEISDEKSGYGKD